MPTPIPTWIRAIGAFERAGLHRLGTLGVATSAVLEEIRCAWLPAALRPALTSHEYQLARTYLPGQPTHAHGLFDWERALMAPPFPARGHILVGGAGGGREARALCERGYRVTAFEPVPAFAAAAARDLRGRATVVCAAYQDLGRPGPLADLGPIDAVWLGWISLSHVLDADARRALFVTLRRLAPDAPVIASMHFRPPDGPRRARALLRRLFARLGAPAAASEGLRFWPTAGFLRMFTRAGFAAEVAAAGYRIERLGERPHGHAMLVPQASAPLRV